MEITNFSSIDSYPKLANALFGAVKVTKNADIDKYRYFGDGIGFDGKRFYSHPSGRTGRNVIIFGADILILGKGLTQGLDEDSLSAEKMYSINFIKINTKILFDPAVTCLLQKFINLQQMSLFQIICA